MRARRVAEVDRELRLSGSPQNHYESPGSPAGPKAPALKANRPVDLVKLPGFMPEVPGFPVPSREKRLELPATTLSGVFGLVVPHFDEHGLGKACPRAAVAAADPGCMARAHVASACRGPGRRPPPCPATPPRRRCSGCSSRRPMPFASLKGAQWEERRCIPAASEHGSSTAPGGHSE